MQVSQDELDRKTVEKVWREVYGHPPDVALVASEGAWALYLHLLRLGRAQGRWDALAAVAGKEAAEREYGPRPESTVRG